VVNYDDVRSGTRLAGKVAIVTGGSGGIGGATVSEFAAEGAAIVVADIDEAGAKLHAATVNEAGGNAIGIGVDVSDENAVREMVSAAVDTFGRLDILHNNAAATGDSLQDDDLVEMSVDLWDRTMAVNLRGPMLGCKHAIPRMLERGGGVIINTSSGAGTLAEPVRTAYGASKAALNSLTRSVAVQYGKQGIRSVAVAPGITLPPERLEQIAETEWFQMMSRHHLTPRLGTPRDIAKLVAFLASDDAGFITGCVFAIDGGIVIPTPYTSEMRGRGTSIF
jgi:NAD(P)-dependent dehydrogenase (short-subunit alcohol dehydrogenase family)